MPSKPKTGRKEVPETKRAAVITWHKAGKSYSQISILEALPQSTVSSIVRRAKLYPQNPTANKKQAGRPRKTSARNERNLCRIAETDNETNLITLLTPSKSRYQLHHQTTRKILARKGLFRRKA